MPEVFFISLLLIGLVFGVPIYSLVLIKRLQENQDEGFRRIWGELKKLRHDLVAPGVHTVKNPATPSESVNLQTAATGNTPSDLTANIPPASAAAVAWDIRCLPRRACWPTLSNPC